MGVLVGADEVDGNFGTGVFSFEDTVEGLEQDGFVAVGHFGYFHIGFQGAVEVDLLVFQVVGAVCAAESAGNIERQIGKSGGGVAQFDVASKIGDDPFRILRFGLLLIFSSAGFLAEGIDILLRGSV